MPSSVEPHAVELREITFATVRQIIALRVSEEQARYVSPNATSIAEGLLNPGGWPRAICDGDVPVGFVMLFDPKVPGAISRGTIDYDSVLLWRLMIDQAHQKRGYARVALDLVCEQARGMGARALLTSYVPGEHGPEQFIASTGSARQARFAATELSRSCVWCFERKSDPFRTPCLGGARRTGHRRLCWAAPATMFQRVTIHRANGRPATAGRR
jgi:diamine N-acetyltransferase